MGCVARGNQRAAAMRLTISEAQRRAELVMELQAGIMDDWCRAQVGKTLPVLVQGYNFGARVDIVDGNISVKTAGEGVKTKVKKLKR